MINSELDKVQANLISAEEDFNNTLITVRNFSDRIYVNKPLQNIITTDFNDVQFINKLDPSIPSTVFWSSATWLSNSLDFSIIDK